MSFDMQPVLSPNVPTFLIHFIQLKGSPALLGAEHVTCRFTRGINVMTGGNNSGKSLLCAAIRAITFPDQTSELRKGLSSAGLEAVTIVGQLGTQRREWHLDLRSGELINRPRSEDEYDDEQTVVEQSLSGDHELPERLPHVIVNGAWPLPDRACLRWAEAMHVLPLARELAAWEERLAALTSGSDGATSVHSIAEELERHDAEIERAGRVRTQLTEAQSRADLITSELTDIEFQLYVAGAEERELNAKIELAARATRLEGWADELRGAFQTVELTRAQFADLQERLETVHETVRGLPDDAKELATRFEALSVQCDSLEQKSAGDEQTAAMLTDRLSELDEQLAGGPPEELRELDDALAQKREARQLAEHDLTELSRQRIDLLRLREGLAQARSERFREFSQLSPDEWRALDEFLDKDHNAAPQTLVDSQQLSEEADSLKSRIEKEFAGFELLPADTHQKIERLFTARMHVSAKDAELIRMRTEAATLDHASTGSGLAAGLVAAGVLGAGLPCAFLLGADIGFFGAVLGGGAGFGLAHVLKPSTDTAREALQLKLQLTQSDLASAEQISSFLETELSPLARHSSPEAALHRWSEFLSVRNRLREVETSLAEFAARNVEQESQAPALLRRLEVEELRHKVREFRELSTQLENAEASIASYDSGQGAGAKVGQLETIVRRLQDDERALELRLDSLREQFEAHRASLAAERAAAETQLKSISSLTQEREQVAGMRAELAALDQRCGGALDRHGPAAIIEALHERERLTTALRETKARLSTDHSPQELAARVDVIEQELAQVTEKLQELDPLYAAVGSRSEVLDKYRGQREGMGAQIGGISERRDALKAELESLGLNELNETARQLPTDEALHSARSSLHAKLEELQKSVDAAKNMCDSLTSELAERRERAAGRVMGLLKKTVFDSIGERIASVEFSDNEWIAVLDDEQRRPLRTLSRGIAELVTLCLNAGLLTATDEAEAMPIAWDDVLAQLDDLHLAIARQVIEQLARKRQVLLFTRDQRIRAWGRPVEVMVGQHELDVLLN